MTRDRIMLSLRQCDQTCWPYKCNKQDVWETVDGHHMRGSRLINASLVPAAISNTCRESFR